MKWFRHETDSKDSEKLEIILDEFGFEGIGRFWRIVEMIADKMDHTDRCGVEYPVTKWCSSLKLKRNKLSLFLVALENQLSFKVEPNQDQTIETANKLKISWPNLLKKKDDYSKYLEVSRKKLSPKKQRQIQIQKEDKDKRGAVAKPPPSCAPQVIEDLNQKAGTNFKSCESHARLIRRWEKEGHALEDFQRVNDSKAQEWLDSEMAKYLRPSTLYGPKFLEYLGLAGQSRASPKTKYEKARDSTKGFSERFRRGELNAEGGFFGIAGESEIPAGQKKIEGH